MAGNLKLDSSHDIIIGRGATRVGGAEQVAQLVKCRLLTVLREWKFDPSLGLPWFEAILTKNVKISDIQLAVSNIINSTPGVRQILDIKVNADFRERILKIEFIAVSTYGKISGDALWPQSNMG